MCFFFFLCARFLLQASLFRIEKRPEKNVEQKEKRKRIFNHDNGKTSNRRTSWKFHWLIQQKFFQYFFLCSSSTCFVCLALRDKLLLCVRTRKRSEFGMCGLVCTLYWFLLNCSFFALKFIENSAAIVIQVKQKEYEWILFNFFFHAAYCCCSVVNRKYFRFLKNLTRKNILTSLSAFIFVEKRERNADTQNKIKFNWKQKQPKEKRFIHFFFACKNRVM